MIRYRCMCGRILQAAMTQVGQTVRCPACDAISSVPPQSEPILAEIAPLRPGQIEEAPLPLRVPGQESNLVRILLIASAILVGGLLALGVFVVFYLRPAAAIFEEQRSLKLLGLALEAHQNSRQGLPPRAILSPEGKPLLSWRVAILPYVEQENLYKEFRLNEPWDSDHNKALISKMPRLFKRHDEPNNRGVTRFLVVSGKGMVFDPHFKSAHGEVGRSFKDITRGLSNTIMVVVAKKVVQWTKPEDIDGDDGKPLLPQLDRTFSDVHIGMVDGSARFLPGLTEEGFRHMLLVEDKK